MTSVPEEPVMVAIRDFHRKSTFEWLEFNPFFESLCLHGIMSR